MYKITYDFDHYFFTKLSLSFCPLLVEKSDPDPKVDTRYPGYSITRKVPAPPRRLYVYPVTVPDTGAVFHRLVAAPSAAAAVALHFDRAVAVVRWPS
jgi:hypothetical protein